MLNNKVIELMKKIGGTGWTEIKEIKGRKIPATSHCYINHNGDLIVYHEKNNQAKQINLIINEMIGRGTTGKYRIKVEGGYKWITRYKLVATTFIPNPNNYDSVDHIISLSEGGTDHKDNLRWMPISENAGRANTSEHAKTSSVTMKRLREEFLEGDLEGEIWKSLNSILDENGNPKYEQNRFEVSNLGRVRDIKHGRMMAQRPCSNGRLTIDLRRHNGDKIWSIRVHALVARLFVEGYGTINEFGEINDQVDHINGIKTDNRAENLEYVSVAENNRRFAKMKVI